MSAIDFSALPVYTEAEVVVIGGGRGEALADAAASYRAFLLALAGGAEKEKLEELLDAADVNLNVAFEGAKKIEKGQ